MKQAKLLLFAFLLTAVGSVRAQLRTIAPATIQKEAAHFIGEKFGGGIVFYITPDGLHGLVAETKDQGNYDWWAAQDSISIVETHSAAGKNFTDWRVPTIYELNLLYNQRTVVGGFKDYYYWSSTEFNNDLGWLLYFETGNQEKEDKHAPGLFRAIRSF